MRLTYAIKYVADMDRAIAFYRDKLGLELKFQSPFWSEFATGDTVLALHPASDDNAPGSVELGFGIDDLGEFYARREQLGIEFTREPREMHGIHIAAIRDADGAHVSGAAPSSHPIPLVLSGGQRPKSKGARTNSGETPFDFAQDDWTCALQHPRLAAMSPAMDTDFYRIQRLPPYVFAEVNAMKAAARGRGEDIVDLGMGNPDGSPPRHVIDKLAEVASKPHAHRYSASRGIPGLRKAQAAYYQRRFGVPLDPDKEVIVTLGSKEGLANLAQAITAPGDVVLAPNPSYPIHSFGFIIAGAAIRSIPAAPGDDFFRRARNGDALHGAAPQGAGDRLSVQPDRLCRRPRLLRAARRLRARA